MTLIVKGGQLGWSESGYRLVGHCVFVRGVSEPPDGFLVWLLWWWIGFSHGEAKGLGRGQCVATQSYIQTYRTPEHISDRDGANNSWSFWDVEPWHNTTTKKKLTEWIEWVSFHFNISLSLDVFYRAHQKENKPFSWHEVKVIDRLVSNCN